MWQRLGCRRNGLRTLCRAQEAIGYKKGSLPLAAAQAREYLTKYLNLNPGETIPLAARPVKGARIGSLWEVPSLHQGPGAFSESGLARRMSSNHF